LIVTAAMPRIYPSCVPTTYDQHPRPTQLLVALTAASLFSVGLGVVRVRYTGTDAYLFLIWNLALAWVPVGCALLARSLFSRAPGLAVLPVAGWVVFLPNAPYMVTDYIHLGDQPGMPLWYDVMLFSSFAWTSMLLGFLSMLLLRSHAQRLLGVWRAHLLAVIVLVLASFGVALGRFPQRNSWDVFVEPRFAAYLLRSSTWSSSMLAFVATFSCFVTLVYWAFYVAAFSGDERSD
jgi:uncharacterized membrane protein